MYKCPIFRVADLIGKKWTIIVIQEVALNGKKGFNAIQNRMSKISPKILSNRLKELESSDIIDRRVIADEMPARTSYTLTKKGKELQEIVTILRKWQTKYSPTISGCERRECVKCPLY